jgi:hypothetical protein
VHFEILREVVIPDLDLDEIHLVVQVSLGFKNISEVLFVPKLRDVLKVF